MSANPGGPGAGHVRELLRYFCEDLSMERGVVELRPGVFRPNWPIAATPAAQEALGARADARTSRTEKWLQLLTPDEDLVWRVVLELYADLRRPPYMTETTARTGLVEPQVRDLLHQLQKRDLLALGSDGDAIRQVYPFTEGKTGH